MVAHWAVLWVAHLAAQKVALMADSLAASTAVTKAEHSAASMVGSSAE
jgi:hypothetical protein